MQFKHRIQAHLVERIGIVSQEKTFARCLIGLAIDPLPDLFNPFKAVVHEPVAQGEQPAGALSDDLQISSPRARHGDNR